MQAKQNPDFAKKKGSATQEMQFHTLMLKKTAEPNQKDQENTAKLEKRTSF